MPELPEVHRAERECNRNLVGKKIVQVETQEDNLVFCDVTNKEFEERILNKIVMDTGRWGKYFYFILNEGPQIVLHFGMAGDIRFKGQEIFSYRRRSKDDPKEWPPRFWKFVITVEDPDDHSSPKVFMAFTDKRRLARVRLVSSALTDPPISELGFDPLKNIPALQDFSELVLKRRCPIKALLLDQSFSAGVGNWIADEVLYQSKIHPNQYANTLNKEQINELYEKMVHVCQTAVDADAEASKYPDSWLFHYRWGKGDKNGAFMPDGEQIIFETVGGRTSAIVPSVQILAQGDSGSSSASGSSAKKSTRQKRNATAKEAPVDEVVASENSQSKRRRKPKSSEGTNSVNDGNDDIDDPKELVKKSRKKR